MLHTRLLVGEGWYRGHPINAQTSCVAVRSKTAEKSVFFSQCWRRIHNRVHGCVTSERHLRYANECRGVGCQQVRIRKRLH